MWSARPGRRGCWLKTLQEKQMVKESRIFAQLFTYTPEMSSIRDGLRAPITAAILLYPMQILTGASLEAGRRTRLWFFLPAILAAVFLNGCGDSGGSQKEYAYVSFPEVALRDRVAAVYNKTGTVHNGERVVVLERMTNRRFVRVRTSGGEEGWIQERYLTDQK